MKEITLIFPDQLFENHPALKSKRPVYLVEEFLFFRVQPFHKQRLVLLRAAMKAYAEHLTDQGFDVHYVDSHQLKKRGDVSSLIRDKEVHLADFSDDWLRQDLAPCKLHFYPSPGFLCTREELREFFKNKNHFSMASFYTYQRKRLNILMKDGEPLGGKFSFDQENRKRLPKNHPIPPIYLPNQSPQIDQAIAYVEKEFPDAIGASSPFLYPVTFKEAKKALADFIKHRLSQFGDYEDAIHKSESFLFHSVLSPLLNIGLLTPNEVLKAVLPADIPLNSLEGFVRQIIGWREFMRACYLLKGRSLRSSNYFQHKSLLPKGFWDGTTGIPPVDATISRILKTGYCHHIERLMVLGNFLLLTKTDPNAVYTWFMSYFVDAYDWVMVPNVYSMSQFADKGQITTKPYICGANYLLKMSNYPKGEWCDTWDGLFWLFLKQQKSLFEKNPRTKLLLQQLIKNAHTIEPKIFLAEEWLKRNGE